MPTDGEDLTQASYQWNQMTRTMFRSPADGELHATGVIDWSDGVVPASCDRVPNGDLDDLETTRKTPTCETCHREGPKWEWSE